MMTYNVVSVSLTWFEVILFLKHYDAPENPCMHQFLSVAQ